jgi:glycolate oxidase iron-sulfur subunit
MGTRLAGLGRRLLAQAFMKKYALEPLGRPFRKTMDNAIWAVTAAIGNIIYFTGCGTNYLYEDTGRAVVKLLRNMGYCIFIPWGQDCCAIPMLFHDAVDQAMGPSGRISHRPCK